MSKAPSPRVALVTGANGAIGQAIAAGIAATRGFEVVMVCRDKTRGARSLAAVQRLSAGSEVRLEIVDLSRKTSIQALAERWEGPLHVLVNNAAQAPAQRTETPEGIEAQWAVNVLSYVWMMEAFAGTLKATAPARIVNVASYWAGGMDLSDPEFKQRPYDNDQAYRQSKQADRMLSSAYAERMKDNGVTVNACHPGDVSSKLSMDLGFGGYDTPEQGAATPVMLATEPIGGKVTGRYFEHRRESVCRFSADREGVEALYALCRKY